MIPTHSSEKEESYMERRRIAFFTARMGSAERLRDGLFSIDDWLHECETICRAWIDEFSNRKSHVTMGERP